MIEFTKNLALLRPVPVAAFDDNALHANRRIKVREFPQILSTWSLILSYFDLILTKIGKSS